MEQQSQSGTLKRYRRRNNRSRLTRFHVHVRRADRPLLRAVAGRLATEGEESARLREALHQALGRPRQIGGILRALRTSPLVGANLNLDRVREDAGAVDL